MQIQLHAGMPKTGTTAIQNLLKARRNDLWRQHGYLVPGRCDAREGLALIGRISLPRILAERYPTPQKRRRAANRFERSLLREIGSLKPQTVVLSCEYLYGAGNLETARLRELFDKCNAQVRLILYVRNPASYYLSSIQQLLKRQGEFPSPAQFEWAVRPFIEAAGRHIADEIVIRPYDQNCLSGRDITLDFQHTIGIDADPPPGDKTLRVNVSLSAEELILRQMFNRAEERNPSRKAIRRRARRRFRASLMATGNPPELTKEIQLYINGRFKSSLEWLRKEHSVEFSEVDYGFPVADPGPNSEATDLRMLLSVDREQCDRIVGSALLNLSRPRFFRF